MASTGENGGNWLTTPINGSNFIGRDTGIDYILLQGQQKKVINYEKCYYSLAESVVWA
jgi:hypothetical protein